MEVGIPYSLETPRGTLYFNGFDQEAVFGYVKPYFRLSEVEGLDGAALRTPTEERPQRDGLIAFPFLRGGRFPALVGVLVPRTLAERRQMEDTLRGHMAAMLNVDGTLRWRPRAAHLRWGTPYTATNLITNALRAAGAEGDGLPANDNSTGVWEATTNDALRGNAFDDAAWTKSGMTVNANQITDPGGVNVNADKITTSVPGHFGPRQTFAVTAGQVWTFSFWAKRGTQTALWGGVYNATAGSNISYRNYYAETNSSTWSRIVFTVTIPGGCTSIYIDLLRDSGVTGDVYFAWAQWEQQPLATPYKHTDGTAATRTASALTGIATPTGGPGLIGSAYGVLRPSDGWVSIAFRPRWASTDDPAGGPVYLWAWGDSGHKLLLYYDPADDKFKFQRTDAGDAAVTTLAVTFAAGDTLVVSVRWTPAEIAISVNGAAEVVLANTESNLSLASAVYSWGYRYETAAGWLDGEILWAALGLGALSAADQVSLSGMSSDDSGGLARLMRGSDFLSDGAMPSVFWNAKSADYLVQQERRVPVRSFEPVQIKSTDILKEFRLGMITPDPLMLSEALYSALITSPSPYLLTIDNTLDGTDGTGLDTLYPVITVQANPGVFNNVDIKNDDTGKFVRLLALGLTTLQTVTVDMRNETVIRNDGVDLSGKVDVTVSEFWGVAPGQSDVASLRNLSGGSVGSHGAVHRLVFAG